MLNELINKAYKFATLKHEKQMDDNGKPYFLHCFRVATILSVITDDADIITAGYLHDTLEDTETTYDELKENFGERVANLVVEVTHEGKKDSLGFYFPNLHSLDGALIKFADRLDNLSRMEAWDEKRREQYLRKSKFWKSSKLDI